MNIQIFQQNVQNGINKVFRTENPGNIITLLLPFEYLRFHFNTIPGNMLLAVSFLLIFSFSVSPLWSQEDYPQGYFRFPIDFTPSLSGTFAEIRSNHFHSGLDYRTGGVEGKPLYAAADGFVSRIRISPGGFGKAIYLEHPNGFSTVYAHVRNFAPGITQYIRSEQYKQESFDVDLYPEPKSIQVKKGEVIAWSGNSGSSGGPHLHFEIRHTHNQQPINPKLFGLNILDNIHPVIQALKIYPTGEYSTINGKEEALTFELKGANGNYWLNQDQPIRIAGEVAFGIQAYDVHNHSNLKNGISIIDISIDDKLVFAYRVNEFAFSETRYVNAVIDYEELMRSKRRFIQTRLLPNNPLRIYPINNNGGTFLFAEQKNHVVKIEVKDAAGNTAKLQFRVAGTQPSAAPLLATNTDNKTFFRYDRINRFQNNDFVLEMPANALYEDVWFEFDEEAMVKGTLAKQFHVHNKYTPVHSNFTIAMKPVMFDQKLKNKVVIVRKDDNGKWSAAGGSFKDGFVTASVRSFGVYSLMADTLAPQIKPLNVVINKNISQQQDIRIKISDDLSGIKSYRGTMNGKWILMDYDAKNDLLVYEMDDRTQKGSNKFKLVVEDQVGNQAVYEATLVR
ncbi:MAG: M23 family metallopeptidase [Bacteroidales bacterium]|nr:M23 family metallopeptidase [Bacteroidales bacterium]